MWRTFCTSGMKLCTNLFTSSLPSLSLPNILRSAFAVSRKLGTELGSQRKLSWIFFSTSCFRCSRDLTAESGLKERIFQTSWSKVVISTRTISLLIQLVLRQCMAQTILSNFFYSPSLLYSKRSTRLPFQKQPETQFFLAVFLKIPLPSKTPFLNQPMYRLPFLNNFSPKPLRCELDMYPLSTTLSQNSSQFLCVQGLQPPCVPRKISVKQSPLMSPPFSKPIVSLFPYFCPSMLFAFLISYFKVLVWTLPITKSYSASSNILLSIVKSVSSSLVIITPFRNDAYVSVFEMKLKSLHLPSSCPSLLQKRCAMYPSVRQTQSTILPFTYYAERRQCWEKKILWPCMRSFMQLVITDTPQS